MKNIGTTRHQSGGGSVRSSVHYFLKRKGINPNRKDVHIREL